MVASAFGLEVLETDGNHVDCFWQGAQELGGDLVAWLEAGQVPMPDFITATVGQFADPGVAVVQAGVGLLNKDSLAHLEGGRDEDAFRHAVALPSLSRHGVAPWIGGGSVVRTSAIRSVGGFDRGDQAALQRAAVRLHANRWQTQYHSTTTVVRADAPDDLDTYLLRRRRRAIEALRVFATPESPLGRAPLGVRRRLAHIAGASAFGTGIRQVGLVLILVATLLTGQLPVGADAARWAVLWIPAFLAATAARRLLARGTMAVGDWSRQGWRTAAADLSAVAEVTGLRRRSARLRVTSDKGLHAIGKLRLLTALVILLDVALVGRGLTLVWEDLLPPFSTAARVMTLALAIGTLVSMLDVLQVAVRRRQRRAQYRLTTKLVARIRDTPLEVVDLTPTGMGAFAPAEMALTDDGEINLRLALPTVRGDRAIVELGALLRSDGVVEGRRRVGFQFVSFPGDAKAALIEYCAIGHHVHADDASVVCTSPDEFDVVRAHPNLTRALSGSALMAGLAALFLGPAAVPALADVAAPAEVCVVTSAGGAVEGADISFFFRGTWQALGVTGPSGCVFGDMPERPTKVAAAYRGIRATMQQNLKKNPTVTFTTVPVAADEGRQIASYHAEEGWRQFEAGQELLPARISFRLADDETATVSLQPAMLTLVPSGSATDLPPELEGATATEEPAVAAPEPTPTTPPTPTAQPSPTAQPTATTPPTVQPSPTTQAREGSADVGQRQEDAEPGRGPAAAPTSASIDGARSPSEPGPEPAADDAALTATSQGVDDEITSSTPGLAESATGAGATSRDRSPVFELTLALAAMAVALSAPKRLFAR